MDELTPASIAPPFARYAHGVVVPEGRRLIVRGRRARLRCTAQSHTLIHDDGAARAILLGDVVTLLDEPESVPGSDDKRFRLDDGTGFVGTVVAPEDDFEPVPAPESAPEVVVAVLPTGSMALTLSCTTCTPSAVKPERSTRISSIARRPLRY